MNTVSATSFTDATPEDWELTVGMGKRKYLADAGVAALGLLKAQEHEEANGWQVNNYQHSLSAATKALRNGEDEEYIVAVLLHDLAQDLDPMRHDRVAGTILTVTEIDFGAFRSLSAVIALALALAVAVAARRET